MMSAAADAPKVEMTTRQVETLNGLREEAQRVDERYHMALEELTRHDPWRIDDVRRNLFREWRRTREPLEYAAIILHQTFVAPSGVAYRMCNEEAEGRRGKLNLDNFTFRALKNIADGK